MTAPVAVTSNAPLRGNFLRALMCKLCMCIINLSRMFIASTSVNSISIVCKFTHEDQLQCTIINDLLTVYSTKRSSVFLFSGRGGRGGGGRGGGEGGGDMWRGGGGKEGGGRKGEEGEKRGRGGGSMMGAGEGESIYYTYPHSSLL